MRVDELNALLKEYANANGISFVDINKELSLNGALNPSHTYDGVHLLGSGYQKWKVMILKELGKI
jgi:lysophospholipase L1-like esterase